MYAWIHLPTQSLHFQPVYQEIVQLCLVVDFSEALWPTRAVLSMKTSERQFKHRCNMHAYKCYSMNCIKQAQSLQMIGYTRIPSSYRCSRPPILRTSTSLTWACISTWLTEQTGGCFDGSASFDCSKENLIYIPNTAISPSLAKDCRS